MWACINRASVTRGGNGNTAVSFSGCGRWSWRCRPRSLRTIIGTGERRPYVSVLVLTHSCRTFYPPPPAPTPPQQLHLQFRSQQLQLLLHNLQSETPTTTTTISPRPTITAAPARNIFRTATNKRLPFFILRRSYSSATMAESELKWPAARVRKTFLEYFEQRGHTIGMRLR